jgi:superfamily II DNA or RNA helicase
VSHQDRRRRPTVDERREIFLRADGRCQNCGTNLGADYHNAHLAAYSNGGPTSPENVEAWCPDCNLRLGGEDAAGAWPLRPRDWQAEALPRVLHRIYSTGVATVNAAPGAGKTLFAGFVFKKLLEAGLVERAVIVAPATIIAPQWEAAFKRLGIYLDTQPRDGYLEHRDTQGLVVMYQGLPGSAEAHRQMLTDHATLVIFDEVHHIAEKASWGTAVKKMVGDLANDSVAPAGVLNLTGTLFRSGRNKRISTVRYVPAVDDEDKLEASADWTIPTSELVGVELRAPNLYTFSGHARLVDTEEETIISGALGDLDQQQRETVLRGLDTSPTWLRGYVGEAMRLLDNQLRATNREIPLKLLYCAKGIEEAKLAADAINKMTGTDFARLIHNKIPQAEKKLRAAVRERKSCAIVQVNMASEGFDCPEVSTIAYASNVTADLRIMQVIARAMRITDAERANNQLIPAQILIPDNPDLKSAFAAVLKDIPRLVNTEDDSSAECVRCHLTSDECACPKKMRCPKCFGEAEGDLTCGDHGTFCIPCGQTVYNCMCKSKRTRYQLIDISGPEFDRVNVLGHDDGEVGQA